MKPDHQLVPYTRILSIWIKYLNISHKTIKILKDNTGSKISDISYGNIFVDISAKARETKEKINK